MENVKYTRHTKTGNEYDYYFKLHDHLAYYVRETTNYNMEKLTSYLNEDNEFRYTIVSSNGLENIHESFVDTVEKISNSCDDADFFYHILTDNGERRSPRDIHALMHEKYGLADIEEENVASGVEKELEWWVAHFFISLAMVFFDVQKDDPDIEQEENSDFVEEHFTPEMSEISGLLDILRKSDKIVIVDDARKVGPADLERILAEEGGHEQNE